MSYYEALLVEKHLKMFEWSWMMNMRRFRLPWTALRVRNSHSICDAVWYCWPPNVQPGCDGIGLRATQTNECLPAGVINLPTKFSYGIYLGDHSITWRFKEVPFIKEMFSELSSTMNEQPQRLAEFERKEIVASSNMNRHESTYHLCCVFP